MIIKLLESQLEASNATISQLRLTVDTLNGTISDLRKTIVNLENLLMERDVNLDKANNQMRGMSKFLEKKSEKQSSVPVAPKTEEEIAQEKAERKARGNNGAKRKMHFEMETIEHDVYPAGMEGLIPFGTRNTVRYEMIPPKFIKHLYHIHTMKEGDSFQPTLPE